MTEPATKDCSTCRTSKEGLASLARIKESGKVSSETGHIVSLSTICLDCIWNPSGQIYAQDAEYRDIFGKPQDNWRPRE